MHTNARRKDSLNCFCFIGISQFFCISFHCNLKDGNLIAIYIKWDTIHRSTSFNSRHHIKLYMAGHKDRFTLAWILFNNTTCWHISIGNSIWWIWIGIHFELWEPVCSFNVINHIAVRAHQAIHFTFSIYVLHIRIAKRSVSMIKLPQMSSNIIVCITKK